MLRLETNGRAVTGLWFKDKNSSRQFCTDHNPDDSLLTEAAKQIQEYFSGGRFSFELPLELSGTDFQKTVWQELIKIPYGTTVSYGTIAKRIHNTKASRAVGGANHNNPIAIIVPCHRVVGADGSLTGYASGTERKRFLLEHEIRFKRS